MLDLGGKHLCSKTLIFSGCMLLIAFARGQLSEPLSVVLEEKTEFLLFTRAEIFDDAVVACVNFDSSATLARVDTLEEFNFIISALDFDTLNILSESSFYRFWIGLRDQNGVATSVSTDRFTYIDTVEDNISFFQEPNVVPWKFDCPRDGGEGLNCVQWISNIEDPLTHKRWIDNRCSFEKDGFLCRRDFVKFETQPLSVVFNDTTEFLFFDQAANFDVASKACSDFDPDSTLARIDSDEEFDFILNALNFKALNGEVDETFAMWIGLNNGESLGNGSVTSSFSYVDGLQDDISFFETPSLKPWANLQPAAVRTSEQCVRYLSFFVIIKSFISWETNEEFGSFWRVQECKALLPGFLCRRDLEKLQVEPLSMVLQNKTEFLLFNYPANFQVASKACKSFNPRSTLARIDSEEEFDFLVNEFQNVSSDTSSNFATWIGLKEENSDSLSDSPDRFTYLDLAQTNPSFFEVPFQKPWEISQPRNTPGIQDCVSWEIAEDQSFSWFSSDCREIKPSFLCRVNSEEVDTANENESSKILLYALLAVIWLLWLMLVALWIRIFCSKSREEKAVVYDKSE